MKKFFAILLILMPFCFANGQSDKAYLFSYFDTKTQAAGLKLAYSYDGYHWTALNNNKAFLAPAVGKDKLMRDPSICQGPDGTFHMVWTTSWHEDIIGYAWSKDLINWSEQVAIPVMADYSNVRNSWAPELYYDESSGLFYIFWASTVDGAKDVLTEGCLSENGSNHRIYCTTTKDFKNFSKTWLYYNPPFNAIDAAVVKSPVTGELIMAVKNENLYPSEKNIRIARAKSMAEGFSTEVSAPISGKQRAEGPAPLFIGTDLIVFFDHYGSHRYGAALSKDQGETWENVTHLIQMPEGMSHGTAFPVDKSVVENLIKHFDQTNK